MTVSHRLSMTTPNDTRYENQVSNWNETHAFTLNAAGSEVSNAFGNAGGVTFGYDGTNVTAAAPAGAPSPVNFSAGTTSQNLASVVFSNSGGISFGLNGSTITGTVATNYQSQGAYLTTAMQSNAATISNINISAGTTSTNASAFTFSNANNFSFGLGTGANAGVVTGSYTVPTVTNSSWTVSDAATSGTVGRLAFTNLNGVTLSLSSGAGGSHTIVGSHNALTSQSNQNVTAGNGGFAFQTLSFSNLNGISFGTSAGSAITASHNAITTGRASTDAIGLNTAQTNVTWTVNSSGLSFNAGGYAGTSSGFTGANISGSMTHNTLGLALSLSVAAPGAAAENNWFNLSGDNTAGNTTASGSTIGLSVQGALTISGTNNSVINISAPATSSIVGTSGISISTAGSTISVYPNPLSAWEPYPILTGSGTSSHAPASFWFSKMILDWDVAVSYANVLKSMNVSAPGMSSQNSSLTNKWSYSHGLTLFTRQDFGANSSKMSQWTTASFGMTGSLSQSSSSASVALSWVTNSTGGTTSFSTTSGSNLWTRFFTGLQMFRIPLVTTLTPGEYFIGQQHSSTTATVGSNFTLLSASNFHIVPQSITIQTVTSSGSLGMSSPEGLGIGVASAVTTNNTMAISVISAGTQNWWWMNFSNT